jgi:hypothetical protein
MKTVYQIVYWREIPVQVKVRSGQQRVARPLSSRFQEAIDAAAMHAKATSTDDYLEDWHVSDWEDGEGDAEVFADSLVSRLEADYPPPRLEELRIRKGYTENP